MLRALNIIRGRPFPFPHLSDAIAFVSLHETHVKEETSRTSFFEHSEQPI